MAPETHIIQGERYVRRSEDDDDQSSGSRFPSDIAEDLTRTYAEIKARQGAVLATYILDSANPGTAINSLYIVVDYPEHQNTPPIDDIDHTL